MSNEQPPKLDENKAGRRKQKAPKVKVVPLGASDPLPPLPDEVKITESDIDRATAEWDRIMPAEFRGLLDAEPVDE